MSSNISWTKILCLAAILCTTFGCGKANNQAPVFTSIGKHPDNWLTEHRSVYQQNRDQCRECHGIDLNNPASAGGIAKVDCFNQAGLGSCHTGGHGPRSAPHQVPFKDGTVHGPEAKKDLAFCQSCHGTIGGPGSNPRFNVLIGSLVNGCEDCHKPLTAHPPLPGATSGWNGHSTAGNLGNSCTLCHGIGLTGGAGPGCNICHTALPAGTIPTAGTCVSCHAAPPASGNHGVHNALAGITNVCGTCHNGAGKGTPKHKNGTVDVAFDVSFNAKSGVAGRNSDGSCSNVSCHGGVTTPAWGGKLANGCRSCHTAGAAQYNGFGSGEHNTHVFEVGLQCTDCHDMSRTSGGASHYSGLRTTVFELPPSATIRVPPGYTSVNPSCTPGLTPPAGTYSVGFCHGNRSWNGD